MDDSFFDKPLTRKRLLATAGTAAASFGLVPGWFLRAAAAARQRSRKVLVVLFQRGAADGLNIVPPFGDADYRKARPNIGIEAPTRGSETIDLDGRFGLHPRLAELAPLWKAGRMAIVHAAGSPDGTRSHFDAQDYMESGTPGVKSTQDGWLNRAMAAAPGRRDPMAAVAIAARLPRTLRGAYPALATTGADQLKAGGMMIDSFESVYDEAADALLAGPARDIAEARRSLHGVEKVDREAFQRAGYPKGRLGRDLFELARLLDADVGLRVGFVEMGGWDHHFNEGSVDGQLARRLDELGGAIAAFYRQLGDRAEDVLLLTMTEFGRALEENGNGGTDHGHASVMLAFGGAVKGARVHGRWPGLAKERLFEQRDLAVTTDYRQVVSEVLSSHCGVPNLAKVFPGGPFAPIGLLA
ncbi:MAG TPA: DUF1501 domain-containing protein [Elusimicrobiota bacterium]|jgi:uncharacterized protein (DUF1501 family)|nr:DUF1501 domain-containing protein [Elusimicrobiota bacterium]